MAGGSGGVIVNDVGHRLKNKCLIDAISEMQQMSAGEAMYVEMPADMFTWSMQVEYFAIGLKAFVAGTIIIALMLPVAIAASMGIIPLFGGVPHLFDKIYMFVLTFGVYGGGLFILVSCGRYVKGRFTKSILSCLYSGAGTAAVFKGIILFTMYQLSQIVISPERIASAAAYLHLPTANPFYYMLLGNYKQIFRISSTIIVIFSICALITIIVTYILALRKLRKFNKTREDYIKHI
jgi:hypothetical protein